MAKYYAMINDRRCGPFTLEELSDAGVRPDTYVWSRDLPDWTHADEVADICQFFRKRIADLKRPRPAELPAPSQEHAGGTGGISGTDLAAQSAGTGGGPGRP